MHYSNGSRRKARLLLWLGVESAAIILGFANAIPAHAALGPNLIVNPSLETMDTAGNPASWARGFWGTNTPIFTYPVTGFGSAKAAEVQITSYTSGDAKWFFNELPVTSGATYQFSDTYTATVPTFVTIQYRMANNTFQYADIGNPAPAAGATNFTATFTVPANVQSATVFHLINKIGTITTDNYSLNQITTTTPPPPIDPANLIKNPSFETTDASGLPANWDEGRFGTNTTIFRYPVTGFGSAKAAEVQITSYTSGDAKWFFNELPVTSGATYAFSDQYTATRGTIIDVQYRMTNNTFQYADIAAAPAAASVTNSSAGFTVPSDVVGVTIFHLIQGIGTLRIDNASLKKTADSPAQNGLVSLNFDDGDENQFTTGLPILDTANLKATFYVVTGRLGVPGSFTKAQVLQLQSDGHEIGAHTRTHQDLTTLPTDQLQGEIVGSKNDLLSLGVAQVNSFAYPFGAFNTTVVNVVKTAFTNARSTDDGVNDAAANKYILNRFGVISTTATSSIHAAIDSAMANNKWLILVFHQIDNSGVQFSASPAVLQDTVNYLKQKKTTVVTMDQAVKKIFP